MNHRRGLQQLIAGEEVKRRRTATVIAILPQGRALVLPAPAFHWMPILAALMVGASIGGLLWVLL